MSYSCGFNCPSHLYHDVVRYCENNNIEHNAVWQTTDIEFANSEDLIRVQAWVKRLLQLEVPV